MGVGENDANGLSKFIRKGAGVAIETMPPLAVVKVAAVRARMTVPGRSTTSCPLRRT